LINERYQRIEGESDIDYGLRLVEILKTERPEDLEWEDIKMLTGFEGNKDSLRKANDTIFGGYSVYQYLKQKYETESFEDEDVLDVYQQKRIELQKEKNKIQTLRLDLNRVIRESSRVELLVEEFTAAIKDLATLPYPDFKPLLPQHGGKEYILCFADVHTGKQFQSITNSFDLEIMRSRFEKLMSETLEIIDENNINHLNILALGDLVEGMIRLGQLPKLRVGVIQQAVEFMRLIVSWLNKLSEYVTIAYYQVPYSNHSQIRPFGSKANEFAEEDVEKLIFAYIHDILEANPRIEIVECNSRHVKFSLFDYNFIACHGHEVKDVDRFIKDVSDKYRVFFDYGFVAHKHSGMSKTVGEGSTNNVEIIRVPSIMGTDDYADGLFVGSKAGATLIEFTENQGKRKTYDIILN
jgi:hypothetical protein